MAAQLGGQQISALLESLPGIASVLRSPVADAIVNMIRAGAGVGDFREADANELVQYAVRRGLLGSDEGEELLAEIKGAAKKKPRAKKASKKTTRAAKAKRVVKKKSAAKKTPSAKKARTKAKKAKTTKAAAKRTKRKR